MRVLPVLSDWKPMMWSCVLSALVSFVLGFWLAKLVGRWRRYWDLAKTGTGL
jgi:hypothetical protein